MRSGIVSLAGCVLLFVSMAPAQTPTFRTGDPAVQGAAGLVSINISPGSLFSIYGSNLASTLGVPDSTTLSTSLLDVDSVTVGGVKAPLQFVSPGQINAQVPWGVPPGTSGVVVTRRGITASATYMAPVSQYSPALYSFGGVQQAIAINTSDFTITSPGPTFGPYGAHPAGAGDIIFFYASGLGPLDKAPPADGVNSIDTTRKTATPLTVTIGGKDAKVDFAGLAPQFTGVYQVNVFIPSGVAPTSSAPVLMAIGGVNSFSSDPTKIATIALR